MINDYPADEVLVQRGKYSTLASARRDHLKRLQEDMQALANYAHRILRQAEDIPFAQTELALAETRLQLAKQHLIALWELEPKMSELKPLAWGTGKEQQE